MNPSGRPDSRHGLLYGLAAYGLWGLIPLYFKSVADVAPLEVLAHRALWSFVMLALLIGWLGRWAELRRELRSPRLLAMLALTSLLIAVNWLTFIYAVVTRQLLQASLGYFVNPLVSVLLGVVFLRERLRPYQVASIALAAVGVVVLAALVGQLPWISLTLAFSFALYGLMRKLMPVDGMVSLAVETLVLAPFALVYLGYLAAHEQLTGQTPADARPADAQRPGDDRAAAVLRRGGPPPAAVHAGHPAIRHAHRPVPAGGAGVRRIVLDAAIAELCLHLDCGRNLYARFVSRGVADPCRAF